MEEERTRLQKIVLLSLAVMTLAFGILTGVSKLHPGVQFGGTLFQPAQTAEKMTYTGRLRGEKVTISVWTEGADVTVVTCETEGWGSNVYRVEYPLDPIRAADGFQKGEMVDGIRILKDGKVLFEGGYDPEGPMDVAAWYDLDGRWESESFYASVSTGSAVQSDSLALDKGNVMYFASGPELTARGSWMLYFVMVFFSGLLALDAAFPLTLFRLRYCCDVRDPEPSDFYLITQRIGWVVCFVLILFGYIWALRSLP